MPYEQQTWNNGAGGLTPLSAERLAHMEAGIYAASVGSDPSSLALAATLLPDGAFASTIPPNTQDISADVTPPSGREYLFAIPAPGGKTCDTITFRTRGTPAGTPTNQWCTLRDKDRNLLGVTEDRLTEAWAANTNKTFAMAVPYDIEVTQRLYVGIVIVATTVPTLLAMGHSNHGDPKLCFEGDAGLIVPGDAPAVATAGSNLGRWAYAFLSQT